MAGIYIHIPFCKSRCVYCDFFTDTGTRRMNEYVDALCSEIVLRKNELAGETIDTIYFGGGTPSRLNQKHLSNIFDTLFSHFSINNEAEITLEANPDDLSKNYIAMLAAQPFNRLSIGIQSFDNKELTFLSRRHNANQAIDAVKCAQTNGFENISIDLMYGLPNQTINLWQRNLQQALNLKVQHISAYHLIYEKNTRLYSLLETDKIVPVSETLSTQMFSTLIDILSLEEFEHYEISNFAKDNRYAKHNTSYWKGTNYIGLGAAAQSFDGDSRTSNIASISKYIVGIREGNPNQTIEYLSNKDKYNEFILTGLRTMWGINLQALKFQFGEKLYHYCLQNAQKSLDNHLVKIENQSLKLTRKGIFISDGIMSELMWIA